MKTLMTTSALALALAAGTVYADSHMAADTNGEQLQQNLENAGESLENAGENAAEATANAAEEAGDAVAETANELAEESKDAAEATADAAAEATDATMETADNAVDGMNWNDSNMIRVRDILGGDIYSVDTKNGVVEFSTQTYDQMGEDWEDIGEIEDIVLSSDGKITGIVAEVGGFLDIGDKHVFLPMENVKLVPVEDESYKVVVGYSEEQLENMQDIDEAPVN